MQHIKIYKHEQLYWLENNKAIGGVKSIDLDRENHQVIIHKPVGEVTASTKLVGCCNLDIIEDEGCPIEDFPFLDEFS